MNIEYTPIHFTRESHIMDYLDKILFYIKSTSSIPTDWKWVILSLHSTLYNVAIAACKGSNDDLIIKKTVDRRTGKNRYDLISINQALTNCQNKDLMERYVMSKVLVLNTSQEESIRKLTEDFRNSFEHFQPGGWMIEIHGFPHMCIDTLEVIDFLIFKSQNCIHFEKYQKDKIRISIDQSIGILSNTTLYKEANYLLE